MPDNDCPDMILVIAKTDPPNSLDRHLALVTASLPSMHAITNAIARISPLANNRNYATVAAMMVAMARGRRIDLDATALYPYQAADGIGGTYLAIRFA